MDERQRVRDQAAQRERENRWAAKGRSKVTHPRYGSVVVPHHSNFSAIVNAAEYWGCDWMELLNAQVWRAEPGDGPAVIPKEFCRRSGGN